METVFFWIAWGIISVWVLKTFYFSFSKEKFERLWKTAIGINISVLILVFLPWLPQSHGGKTGLAIALEGNLLTALFIVLLLVQAILFIIKESTLLKLAVISMVINTFVLFILMLQLRPESFTLTLFDIAPIIAALFLLLGNVVGLLLWQQLKLKEKKRR